MQDNTIFFPLIDYLLSSPSIRTTINFLFMAFSLRHHTFVLLGFGIHALWENLFAAPQQRQQRKSRVQNHQHKNHLLELKWKWDHQRERMHCTAARCGVQYDAPLMKVKFGWKLRLPTGVGCHSGDNNITTSSSSSDMMGNSRESTTQKQKKKLKQLHYTKTIPNFLAMFQ